MNADALGALLTALDRQRESDAQDALRFADECVTLAEIDATELDRAERALADAERLGKRAGILPERA